MKYKVIPYPVDSRVIVLRCSGDLNPVKKDGWYPCEYRTAKKQEIDLSKYEFIGHMPGMATRGISTAEYRDGYDLFIKEK